MKCRQKVTKGDLTFEPLWVHVSLSVFIFFFSNCSIRGAGGGILSAAAFAAEEGVILVSFFKWKNLQSVSFVFQVCGHSMDSSTFVINLRNLFSSFVVLCVLHAAHQHDAKLFLVFFWLIFKLSTT